jgi:hypothetical protein
MTGNFLVSGRLRTLFQIGILVRNCLVSRTPPPSAESFNDRGSLPIELGFKLTSPSFASERAGTGRRNLALPQCFCPMRCDALPTGLSLIFPCLGCHSSRGGRRGRTMGEPAQPVVAQPESSAPAFKPCTTLLIQATDSTAPIHPSALRSTDSLAPAPSPVLQLLDKSHN